MEEAGAGERPTRRSSSTARFLRATAHAALDLAFPWKCVGCGETASSPICGPCRARVRWIGDPVCSVCGLPLASGPNHACSRCAVRPPAFRRARAAACYRSSEEESDPLGIAIRALKYAGRRALAGYLSALFAERFPLDGRDYDVLVPVPLHLARLRSRGFNQALLLARGPARRFGLRVEARALVRLRPTPPQVGLDEKARRRNLRGALAVRPGIEIEGKRVLLVDDVLTSGATADACARALGERGAAFVDVAALARAL